MVGPEEVEMTVKELIEKLGEYPGDTEVFYVDHEDPWKQTFLEIDEVDFAPDWENVRRLRIW